MQRTNNHQAVKELTMNNTRKWLMLVATGVISIFSCGAICAQTLPPDHALTPLNPTSADSLKLSMPDFACTRANNLDIYQVKMSKNNIVVEQPEKQRPPVQSCTNPPRLEFDLGRLPAGNYTLTMNAVDVDTQLSRTLYANVPLVVADARAAKQSPYVGFDYSGLWWDPADSGSGLFIWQDANDPNDAVLAAWFTYSVDGKPQWFVFQPKWETTSITLAADLIQTSRKPGPTVPPPNPTSSNVIGTAKLNFFGDAQSGRGSKVMVITLKGQAPLVIKIERFKP